MPGYAAQRNRGEGVFRSRVVVAGWPDVFVTSETLAAVRGMGIKGFSSSSYYYLPSTNDLDGSATMTRSVLFRYDSAPGATQMLVENYDGGAGGYLLQLSGAGLVQWVLYDGAPHTVQSAALTVGEVYCVTVTWNGATQRVIVGQTATSGTPAITYVPATSSTPAVGAFHGGGSSAATGLTILGVASSDTVALSEADAKTHNAACLASGRMEGFSGVQNLWRAPELETDLVGSLDWTVNGSGLVRAAVRIPTTESDGRARLSGLDPLNLRISARVDLARAGLRQQEQTFEIVDDDAHAVTASLGAKPTAKCWLTSTLTAAATTANVTSTAGFAASGVIHVNTEAIAYSGKTATTFTGLTRAHWDTYAQDHPGPDGDRMPGAQVTDRPRTLRGRPVKVYLYGRGDDATGAGTLKWQGVARTDRAYQAGTWSWAAAPLSARLEQPVGGDLEEPLPISGIYLPATACLVMGLQRWDSAALDGSAGTTSDAAFVRLSGRFLTNEDFVSSLNAKIATATSGWSWGSGASLTAESLGSEGWRLVYRTDGTTAHYVTVTGNPIDHPRGSGSTGRAGVSPVDLFARADAEAVGAWEDLGREVVRSLDTGSVYSMAFAAPVPRAFVGLDTSSTAFGSLFTDPSNPDATAERLYLGGNVALSSSMYVAVSADGGDDDDEAFAPVAVASSSTRFVEVPGLPAMRLGPRTRVRLARELATNQTLGGLITTLWGNGAALVNYGAIPFITSADFDFDFSAITEAAADLGLARRTWISQEGVSLREIVEHECRLLGVYLSVRSNGALTFRRLRAPTPTDVEAARITPRNTTRGLPGITYSPDGILKEVLFRQGWSWLDAEHKGLTIRARNAETADPSVLGGSLEVAPRSNAVTGRSFGLEIDPEAAYSLASTVLGLFGGAYRLASFGVTMGQGDGATALLDAELGKTVLVSSPFVPDSDGTMGITLRPGILVGYDWSPFEGDGTVEVFFTDLDVAGYAPELPVASEVDNGGDEWTLTVTTTDYVPSGTDAADWFVAGDEVRVFERGTTAQSLTSVSEVTGNGSAVTVASSPFVVGPGGYLGARRFDGGGGSSVATTAAIAAALKSDCTVTWWARFDATVTGAEQAAFSFYGGSGETEGANVLLKAGIRTTGYPWIFYEYGAGTNASLTSTGTVLKPGRWYRFDVVRTQSSGTIEVYIDGALDDSWTSQPDASGGEDAYNLAIAESAGANEFHYGELYGLTVRDVAKSSGQIGAEAILGEPDADTIGMWLRHEPDSVPGDVVSATATTVTVQFDATWTPGSGDWRLGYRSSSAVDEAANGSTRWAQSDFAFVSDTVRRLTLASGDRDSLDFSP